MVFKLYQRSLGYYNMNITWLDMSARAYAVMPHGDSARAYAVMPQATTGSKSLSCLKIRHVIATFIYAVITLPKHRFESHKSVNMHAWLLM